eukprot:gene1028-1008_t
MPSQLSADKNTVDMDRERASFSDNALHYEATLRFINGQSQRLNVVASNLANADAVAGPDGQAYKARQVMFQSIPMGSDATVGVQVSDIVQSNEPSRKNHQPSHPSADAQGMVTYSNVNPIEEMVNMISASRAYQNNVEVMNTAKTLLLKTLQMGQ